MKKEKEAWQIKHYYEMPDGRIVHCIYQKVLKKLESGKYGEGDFKEVA